MTLWVKSPAGVYFKTGDSTFQVPRLDASTHAISTIEYEHHEIHAERSFSAYYTRTTAATNAHRSGLYIKTDATIEIHMVIHFAVSTAAYFTVCENPTIAANTGTHGVAIYNRDRNSDETSVCLDNATSAALNKYTTLNETQISGDGTWATGTILRTEPLEVGKGSKAVGGEYRGVQEYILKKSTDYVFLLTNSAASANVHHIHCDWYEHTRKSA